MNGAIATLLVKQEEGPAAAFESEIITDVMALNQAPFEEIDRMVDSLEMKYAKRGVRVTFHIMNMNAFRFEKMSIRVQTPDGDFEFYRKDLPKLKK